MGFRGSGLGIRGSGLGVGIRFLPAIFVRETQQESSSSDCTHPHSLTRELLPRTNCHGVADCCRECGGLECDGSAVCACRKCNSMRAVISAAVRCKLSRIGLQVSCCLRRALLSALNSWSLGHGSPLALGVSDTCPCVGFGAVSCSRTRGTSAARCCTLLRPIAWACLGFRLGLACLGFRLGLRVQSSGLVFKF